MGFIGSVFVDILLVSLFFEFFYFKVRDRICFLSCLGIGGENVYREWSLAFGFFFRFFVYFYGSFCFFVYCYWFMF